MVGFGSYHSFPILAAALLCRSKIVLFEANCIPGKVIRVFAPFAHLVASQFPLSKSSLVPLLPWKSLPALPEQCLARSALGLDPNCETVLVFGGSQGAKFLNEQIPSHLPQGVQVIHLTGGAVEQVAKDYKQRGIHAIVKTFETDMPLVYAAASCAICRSGASTLAELIQFHIPALLIPFPFAADDHQRINAEFLAKKIHGAKMILQHEKGLVEQIEELFREKELLKKSLVAYSAECKERRSLCDQIMGIR